MKEFPKNKKKRKRRPVPPKFSIGTRVGKKKVSASLHLPNKTGVVVGHGEKFTAAGAAAPFYMVQLDSNGKIEHWVPGIIFELNTDEPQNRVAFI